MTDSTVPPQKEPLSVWAFRTAAARSTDNLPALLVRHWGGRSPPELTEPEWHQYLVALVRAGGLKAKPGPGALICSRG